VRDDLAGHAGGFSIAKQREGRCQVSGGGLEQAAEKLAADGRSIPQALKRGHIFND